MASRDEVFGLIQDAISLVQTASGRDPEPIAAQTELFNDIEDFDSLNALEVLVQVGASLDVEIPDEVLVRGGKQEPLTVGGLVDRIVSHVEGS